MLLDIHVREEEPPFSEPVTIHPKANHAHAMNSSIPLTDPATFRLSTCVGQPDLPDDTVESLLEPPDALLALDAVAGTDTALAPAAAGDALTGPSHASVEVHAVNADCRVVLDAQVDVLADAEAEVARLAEVPLAQLVLLDLEAALQDLLGLGAADGDVHGDLLVSSDTEGSDGVSRLACVGGDGG